MRLEDLIITDQRLGEGGFGTVFVGRLGEIKVAAKRLSQSEKEFNNLTREASKLMRLRHGKHITYIYGITMKDGNLYMVMEYCKHGDLKNYLQRNKESVTYEQKILFCRGILLGLLYCHSMKVFHGDIKCSNVILGKNLEPKLTDFGLSMTVDNIEYYSKLCNGSLYWVAPELFSIRNEAVYQKFITNPYPCDVYSLGAIFCEISYNGTTEFIDSDEPDMDIMLGIVSPTPKDAFLEEIVSYCCQFDRSERISLEECFSMLEKIAEGQLSDPANQSGFDFLKTTENEWKQIQKQIKAKPTQALPPSFILHRPNRNLVVGLSNLSFLEWLCVNDCKDAVQYMIELHKLNKKQIQWLYSISKLCESSNTARLFQGKAYNYYLNLSKFMDSNPQQFIEALIRAGAKFEHDLLKKAIEKHYDQVVQTLVGLNVYSGGRALHVAIDLKVLKAVKTLATDTCLEIRNRNDDTPLLAAINTGDVEIVKILLDLGADIHSKNEPNQHSIGIRDQYTPLTRAAVKGNYEMVEILINAGATIDVEGREWHFLVQNLKQQGKSNVIKLISDAMKKIGKAAEYTLLCTAIRNGQSDLVQKLIDDGIDANEQDCDRYSPLHWAVSTGDEEITRILLTVGANIDIKTPNAEQNQYSPSSSSYFDKYTPLHIAIAKRHLGIAKLLIESGADFSAKNGLDQTITDIANEEDQKEIERIIRNYAPTGTKPLRRAVRLMGTETVGAITMETVKAIVNRQQVDTDILSGGLNIAASYGNTEAVNYFMECGADVSRQYNSWSPLKSALFDRHAQIARILISAGANINARDDYGRTPLFESVKESLPEIAKLLIDKGVNVNVRDKDVCAPVHYAKCREVMQILIDANANVNAENWCRQTSLHQYVIEAQTEIVQFLVDKGAHVNTKDIYSCAPIYYAKSREFLEILINANADINVKNKYEESLLHLYVKKAQIEIVQFLVNKGADVNARDKNNYAPIYYADNAEVVQILINANADINVTKKYGESLLHLYVKKAQIEMVQFLVNKGANVNARDKDSHTAIYYAKSAEIMEILINGGADVNAKDQYKDTLLHQYVKKVQTEMVRFLVNKGANVNLRDGDDYAPIHHVRNRKIAEILVNAGADIDVKDKYEKKLFNILIEEQNENLGNTKYQRKEICELLEYLRKL